MKTSKDLIERQALMKELSDFVRASNNSDFARTPTWNDAVSLVGSMPSAQPERKKGSWTDDNACPFCGFQPWYERDIHTLSYCPNCGADMRGDNDD